MTVVCPNDLFQVERQGEWRELRELYNKEVVSAHKGHKGIRFVHLLESLDNKDEGISITAWDTKADVEAYEKSGEYEKLLKKFKICMPRNLRLNPMR